MSLFGNLNPNNNNKGNSIFSSGFINNKKEVSSTSFTNNSYNKKLRNNKNNVSQNITKCIHKDNIISYCLNNSNNDGGLICYDCLYKYHKEHISKCLPIKNNNFENYKNYYKQYINGYQKYLKDKFNQIISVLEKYENEEIDNIYTLFKKKILKLYFYYPPLKQKICRISKRE